VRIGGGLSHVDASAELVTVWFWDDPVHGFEMPSVNGTAVQGRKCSAIRVLTNLLL
jgi:hypothetical protein